jgi:hypothetical protein
MMGSAEKADPKAVFAGRFFSVSRVLEALVAGTSRMHWDTFVFYSVLGGTIWATAVMLAGSSLPGWTIHRKSISSVKHVELLPSSIIEVRVLSFGQMGSSPDQLRRSPQPVEKLALGPADSVQPHPNTETSRPKHCNDGVFGSLKDARKGRRGVFQQAGVFSEVRRCSSVFGLLH